ncbi:MULTISPECIES: hypothetical protein [Halomonadaceae]|uniref:hypothetical protein n=1 Tax=Halomonadaceae TaxID=28256 RepID=UPI00159B2209|nr:MULTISPECIES: hypothetical protein [Halomonas]QJQ93945.1 hypothetical protein HIO72_00625 [Halomonas sp. PA5]
MITTEQRELLQQIQSLALAAGEQTGRTVYHETRPMPSFGIITSWVRVIDDNSQPLHDSEVVLPEELGTTLAQQRDMLASWIALNRQEKAA